MENNKNYLNQQHQQLNPTTIPLESTPSSGNGKHKVSILCLLPNYVRRTIIVGNDNSKLIPSSYKYN